MRAAPTAIILMTTGLLACPSRRLLVLENRVLNQENTELHQRLQGQLSPMGAEDFDPQPTLETVHRYLERAGYNHEWTPEATQVRMEFVGINTDFSVVVRHFDGPKVLFLTTRDYASLDLAADAQGAVLLLTTLATLNYELLLGKLQLDPETGEILLSAEIHVGDGLGYATFVQGLELLLHGADRHYTDIVAAASGRGI